MKLPPPPIQVDTKVEVKQVQFEQPIVEESPQMAKRIGVEITSVKPIVLEEKEEVQEEEISFPAESISITVSPIPAPAANIATVVEEVPRQVEEEVVTIVSMVQEEVEAFVAVEDEAAMEGDVFFPVQSMPASVLRALSSSSSSSSSRQNVTDVKVHVKGLDLGLDDAVFEIRRAVAIQVMY